jgi:serine protease Do
MLRALAIALMLSLATAARADVPLPLRQSLAPLIEKTAPAVTNIYARKIIESRSPTRHLDGSAFWRLFRDTLLFGYGQDRIENSLGSGVIVGADGIVVTNNHVVEFAEGIFVALADGRTFQAQVLLADKRTDLAVLRIQAGDRLPIVELGDSDLLKVGDPVIAIGNPFGLGQTVTSGIVSALARSGSGIGDFRYFIQTDAAINPGNSGGALIALDGTLSGINTAIFSTSGGSQGVGFAIPSNMVRIAMDAALQGRPLVRPWIGLSGSALEPHRAAVTNMRGVRVNGVYPGGPAEKAGLRLGDIILSIDGFAVGDPQALRYRLATRRADGSVRLRVLRQNNSIELAVTPVPPPDVPPRDETRLPPLSPLRGARAVSLSPALADELGLDTTLAGVVLLDVPRGSAAARLGLQTGDIVQALDGRRIGIVAELLDYRIGPFRSWSLQVVRAGRNIILSKPAHFAG